MKRKLMYWGTGVAIVAIIGIPALVLLQHWMNGPTNGSVHNGSTIGASQLATASEPQTLQTPYFTTSLPSSFGVKQRHETPDDKGVLLTLLATTSSQSDQQFAMSVGRVPAGGISSLGDYNLRAAQTGTYTSYDPPGLPTGAIAFRTTSGPAAFTVFWAHGNQYAEMALSADANTSYQPLETSFQQIMTNWQWR
jgi:hypothetical protein